jgi:hypothetical protein
VVFTGPFSGPAEATSETSAALPADAGQASKGPPILNRKVAQFCPARDCDRSPEGGLPVASRHAGDRGILGGLYAWYKMGAPGQRTAKRRLHSTRNVTVTKPSRGADRSNERNGGRGGGKLVQTEDQGVQFVLTGLDVPGRDGRARMS